MQFVMRTALAPNAELHGEPMVVSIVSDGSGRLGLS
jgi:hypothetical protein